jgi:REP element-mobilizing transposase RayT
VTICTRDRECVLDDPIVTGIITDVWWALPRWFPTIALDEFVTMPNHVHLIVWLRPTNESVGATLAVAPGTGYRDARKAGASPAPTWVIPEPGTLNENPTLGDVIGAFKSLVFGIYLRWVKAHDPQRRAKFWQRNYYEHIVRDEKELYAIRRYIRENMTRWALDRDNPDNLRGLPPPAEIDDYLAEALEPHEHDDGE